MQIRLSRSSFTPANKPFVADKAKSVQAAAAAFRKVPAVELTCDNSGI
jgi:hypothetical protein